MNDFNADLLPLEMFYKQMKDIRNGVKRFKPLDKSTPKTVCPTNNYLALNEHFKKVMDKCLLPEDFRLE
jgi:hypothetical protein